MSTFKVENSHVVPHGSLLEGVTYDERTDSLYYIDIPTGTVFTIPESSMLSNTDKPLPIPQTYVVDKSIGVIGLTSDVNKLICGIERGISVLDLNSGSITSIAKYPNDNIVNGLQLRSNDGSIAPDGSYWIGTMDYEETGKFGSMWKLTNKDSNSLIELWNDCGIPNGINWDIKRGLMYWTDSTDNTIYRYKYNVETNEVDINSKEPWFVNNGTPDGSCIDADGNLYVCLWGSNKVVRFTPDGKIDMEWIFPSKNVTCCIFGGKDFNTLYVTTASLTPDDEPNDDDLGAALYKIDVSGLNIKGVPKYKFQL